MKKGNEHRPDKGEEGLAEPDTLVDNWDIALNEHADIDITRRRRNQ